MRRLARRTWAYFEHFANEDHGGLPPDNFQEIPAPMVADRTSPTNIGLGLASALAAVDFGYLSPGGFLGRTARALDTLDKLERYRGHFYNWYDLRTLQPLRPLYVSSVDSGNLAAMLLVVREGLLEAVRAPILPPAIEDPPDGRRHPHRRAAPGRHARRRPLTACVLPTPSPPTRARR